MTNVGLLLVGVVLFVNGASLLGAVRPRDAVPINFFVGGVQVVFPTLAMLVAGSGLDAGYSVAALYLFGFTYLYVALNTLMGNDGSGLGWFSLFVVAITIWSGITSLATDPAFAVIWFVWAVMWLMFFLSLALGVAGLTGFTGWLLLIGSHLTATIPALMIFEGVWSTSTTAGVVAAVIAVVLIALCAILGRVRPVLIRQKADPDGAGRGRSA
ncbi:AmiS/UreI family transporter [Microbacterium sp.]|uniref:AmiS/UreI family transporter n=1 Tax=Microbacterium sp. TaxID=51671 RepID=UPI003A8C4451